MSAAFTNKTYSFQSWSPLNVLSNINKIHPSLLPEVIFKCLTTSSIKAKGKSMFSKSPKDNPTLSLWADLILNKISKVSLIHWTVPTRSKGSFPPTPYKATRLMEIHELLCTLAGAPWHVIILEFSIWLNPIKVQDHAFPPLW